MEYVTLGKTGMKISRLGFGGIPIQRIDAEAAGKLLEAVRAQLGDLAGIVGAATLWEETEADKR